MSFWGDCMNKVVVTLVLLVGLLWAGSAQAAVEAYLDCPKLPRCCMIDCIMLAADCETDCGCECVAQGPLYVDFLDEAGAVLGSAKVEGDWCCGYAEAQLDKPVDSELVCEIRV